MTKEFKIEHNEIVAAETYLNPTQTMLKILQDKGAPIKGTLYLAVEDGYAVTSIKKPDYSYTFIFEKKYDSGESNQ